jgi:aminoglycoside phosphotransferase (APT) family kinase protein
LVLRRFTLPAWQEPELAEREARVLGMLRGSGLPVPEVIALDAHAEHCEVPALLMTRLPGRIDLQPRDLASWLRRLAEPLPAIHALPIDRGAVQPYAPYYEPAIVAPAWSAHPDAWKHLDSLVRGSRPPSNDVFIHRDYHPANILWSRGRVSGILDWINASFGPREIDVAHCRVDIGCLVGVEAADAFLRAYCTLVGESVTEWNPYWDAHMLCDVGAATDRGLFEGWQGVLSLETVHARNDAFVVSIAARS